MKLNYFRDKLFDLLNDSEGMGIADLNADEQNSLLTVRTEDGDVFEIVCRQAAGKEFIMGEVLSKNRRRRFFYRETGWNRPVFPLGIKLP